MREVARLLQSANLGEIALESDGARLLVQRETLAYAAPVAVPASDSENVSFPSDDGAAPEIEATSAPKLVVVSDWVGVFRAPKKPVSPSESVKKKQILGVVESLKVPFEVFAPADGTVGAILVSDGQGVEWGQPLFEIETA